MNFEKADPLKGISFFKELTDEQRKTLRDEIVLSNHAEGATVIKEGDIGRNFYVVISGSVKIVKKVPGKSGETETLLGIRKRGELIGEMALIEEQPRSADVIAEKECWLVEFDKKHYLSLIQKYPSVFLRLIQTFSHRLRETDNLHVTKISRKNEDVKKQLEERDVEIASLKAQLKELKRQLEYTKRK